jgi:hypothetical protein
LLLIYLTHSPLSTCQEEVSDVIGKRQRQVTTTFVSLDWELIDSWRWRMKWKETFSWKWVRLGVYTPVFTLRRLSLHTWFVNNCWPNCVWVGHVQVHLYILLHAIRYQFFVYCTGSTIRYLQCCREIFTITIWMYLKWHSSICNLMRVACKEMSDYSYKWSWPWLPTWLPAEFIDSKWRVHEWMWKPSHSLDTKRSWQKSAQSF